MKIDHRHTAGRLFVPVCDCDRESWTSHADVSRSVSGCMEEFFNRLPKKKVITVLHIAVSVPFFVPGAFFAGQEEKGMG